MKTQMSGEQLLTLYPSQGILSITITHDVKEKAMRKIIYTSLIVAILLIGGTSFLTDHCPEWLYWQVYGYQLENCALGDGWWNDTQEPVTVTPEEYARVLEAVKDELIQ